MAVQQRNPEFDREVDAVIVGAGFAGMYLVHRLRGIGLSVRAYEAASDVGGTWYWNRYPGCRVDVVSMEYSYQFSDDLQQSWEWSEKYATQPEILKYANHVADRFELRRDIRFGTQVKAATYDEAAGRWTVETDRGDRVSARYIVLATGILSTTNFPDIEGLDSFEGQTCHTGKWPHEPVDFGGRRVGVIGTGSSAVQVIPLIAQEAEHLTVFQRTPNYVIPAHNEPLDPGDIRQVKQHYREFREKNKHFPFGFSFIGTNKSALGVSNEERNREFEASWQRGGLMFLGTFNDLLFDQEANATAQEFFRDKIRATVKDPEVAERLLPDFALGCKRLSVGTDYYETYNRLNVTLVDVKRTPIARITARGMVVGDREHPLDAIVFATGFDAIQGPILGIDIRGRKGRAMRDKWSNGPHCYLGLMAEGFPNLFTMTGPGSPSLLSNLLPSIEQHADFIGDCIEYMRGKGLNVIEPILEAEQAWLAHVDEIADRSVYKSCDSWYLGSNIPGKPRVFTAYIGWPQYREELEEIVADGYRGFKLSSVTALRAEAAG